jgi:hypothetical protein
MHTLVNMSSKHEANYRKFTEYAAGHKLAGAMPTAPQTAPSNESAKPQPEPPALKYTQLMVPRRVYGSSKRAEPAPEPTPEPISTPVRAPEVAPERDLELESWIAHARTGPPRQVSSPIPHTPPRQVAVKPLGRSIFNRA